jgi:hypothetical protein
VIIVDTTVLAYAVGDEHPLREPCRRLLAAHANGTIEATTTVEPESTPRSGFAGGAARVTVEYRPALR